MQEISDNQTNEISSMIVRVREQWGAVIQTVVAACNGNQDAATRILPFLNEMEQKDDWRALVGVLRRILAGEREPLALLRGLDETDTVVAGDVLRGLGVDTTPTPTLPRSNPPLTPPASQGENPRTGEGVEHDDDDRMVSLEDFLRQVVCACKPDAPAGLAEQMRAATRGMATQANLAPELRELGRVLNQVLSGARNPDLSALHPQLAEAVKKILGELG